MKKRAFLKPPLHASLVPLFTFSLCSYNFTDKTYRTNISVMSSRAPAAMLTMSAQVTTESGSLLGVGDVS